MDPVEEVKSKVDIVALINEYVPLKKAGKNFKGLCPFHGEKTPSFMVSPELQMYKCFGCGKGGDAFSFLMEFERMEFYEALKFLAQRVGVKLKPLHPEVTSEKEKLLKIHDLAKRFYNYCLLTHPSGKKALAYLTQERGLKIETIKKFELGYSPDVSGALTSFLVRKKGYKTDDLERAGIVVSVRGEAIDRFRGRVIFPLSNHRGDVIAFAGRVMPGPKAERLAKYINSPETLIYHKSACLYGLNISRDEVKKTNLAVIVEGELDMISSYQAGVRNVVAIKGSALTDEQTRILGRFAEKIILALDSDFAGNVAARRGIVIAQNQGLEVRVASLGDYKDPDDIARANPDLYRKYLTDAAGVWDFIIVSVFAKFGGEGGEDKAKISRELVPILFSIPDRIVQAHYIEKVAEKLEVPSEAVYEQIKQVGKEKGETGEEKGDNTSKSAPKSRRQLLEERLLSLAFNSDPSFLLDKKVYNLVSEPLLAKILAQYKEFVSDTQFSLSAFAQKLPKELLDGMSALVMNQVTGLEPEKEINMVVRELTMIDLKSKMDSLGGVIKRLEKEGQKEKLKEAEGEFGRLASELKKLE